MDTVGITKKVCLMLCLCLVSAVGARAANLCATDSVGGTILLRTDINLDPGAVVGLHGSLTTADGTLIPLYGTAVVNAKATSMLIAVQGLRFMPPNPGDAGQHVGILINTDLTLNGTGNFETLTATGSNGPPIQRFTWNSSAVTWTASSC